MSHGKLIAGFALAGFGIPLAILAIDWITTGWYPVWVTYVWPTWIFLLPYGGEYFGIEELAVAIVSIGLNAALYALIGYGVERIIRVVKHS